MHRTVSRVHDCVYACASIVRFIIIACWQVNLVRLLTALSLSKTEWYIIIFEQYSMLNALVTYHALNYVGTISDEFDCF